MFSKNFVHIVLDGFCGTACSLITPYSLLHINEKLPSLIVCRQKNLQTEKVMKYGRKKQSMSILQQHAAFIGQKEGKKLRIKFKADAAHKKILIS